MTKMSAESAFCKLRKECIRGRPFFQEKDAGTHLGETPEPHHEGLGRKEHPLHALHLAFTFLVELDFFDNEVILTPVEEARVALSTLQPAHLLERDGFGFGRDGCKVVEELSRTDERTERE